MAEWTSALGVTSGSGPMWQGLGPGRPPRRTIIWRVWLAVGLVLVLAMIGVGLLTSSGSEDRPVRGDQPATSVAGSTPPSTAG